MYEGYIESASAIVKLKVDEKAFFEIIKDEFFVAYIPSVKVLDKKSKKVDATIEIKQGKKNKIKIKYPYVIYEYVEKNIKDIISLIEFILERSRQEKGIICIHGAGAILNNKLVVFWGTTTGMGKTSMAIILANNDNLFYSDEKILINLKTKKAVGRIKTQYLSNKYWKNKHFGKDYHIPLNLSKDKDYDIGLFIQPILCKQEGYIFDEWDEKKFLWHLYEESSRKIRGTSRVFFNGKYPAPSLDTKNLATRRLKLIKKFTNEIKAIYFKGDFDSAFNLIKQYIN